VQQSDCVTAEQLCICYGVFTSTRCSINPVFVLCQYDMSAVTIMNLEGATLSFVDLLCLKHESSTGHFSGYRSVNIEVNNAFLCAIHSYFSTSPYSYFLFPFVLLIYL